MNSNIEMCGQNEIQYYFVVSAGGQSTMMMMMIVIMMMMMTATMLMWTADLSQFWDAVANPIRSPDLLVATATAIIYNLFTSAECVPRRA